MSDVYTITATVTDDDGGVSASSTVDITVKNVVPIITGLNVDSAVFNANGSVTISGSFTDEGTPDTPTVWIDWGYGGTSSAALVATGSVAVTFTDTPPYLTDNPAPRLSDV